MQFIAISWLWLKELKAESSEPDSVKFRSQTPSAALVAESSVGTWLSLVEHSLGVRGVGSSNLPVPTNSKHSTFADSDVGRES